MVDKAHELPVARQAKLLKISRGTVYYLPRPVSPTDLVLMRRMDELHLEPPFMGARMLRDQLGLLGLHVGRKHIRTLMRRMDIQAIAPQPGTSKAQPGNKIYPYLLRHQPSFEPIRSGAWILPTSPWPKALFT
jgi:putative transposase